MKLRKVLSFLAAVVVVAAILASVGISLFAVAHSNSQRHADAVALCHARNYTRTETQASFDQLFADVKMLVARGPHKARGQAEIAKLQSAFDSSYRHRLPQLRCPAP